MREGFGSGVVFDAKIPLDNQLDIRSPEAKTGGIDAYRTLAKEAMDHVNLSRNAAHASADTSREANVGGQTKNVDNLATTHNA
jgi:hypothetical protein